MAFRLAAEVVVARRPPGRRHSVISTAQHFRLLSDLGSYPGGGRHGFDPPDSKTAQSSSRHRHVAESGAAGTSAGTLKMDTGSPMPPRRRPVCIKLSLLKNGSQAVPAFDEFAITAYTTE